MTNQSSQQSLTLHDQRNQTLHGDQINVGGDYIVHSGEPELTLDEVHKQLELYRERLCKDTDSINLTGIPLHSVNRNSKISLQDVYIRIQGLEEDQSQQMRKREEAELEAQMQKITGEIDAHRHRLSLRQLLTLGEYYYRRGESVEQQERPTPVDPIQAAQDHQRLVLLGAPGSGKSTLLRYLAHQATVSAEGPIPILFPLSHFGLARAKDINATLREEALHYAAAGDPLILRALKQAVEKKQILWLLDGLDETQDKTVSQQISALPNQDRIVVTSRPIGYQPHQLGSFSLFEILPLTVDNSHKFIRDWMTTLGPEGAKESIVWLEQQLHERPWLQPLTSNPLLLTFLVILACEQPRRALPSTRHALYERYIDSLFTTWEKERNERLLTLPSQLYHQGILSIGWCLHLAFFGHTLSLAEADTIKIGSDSIPRRESISKRLADHLQQHEMALLQGTPASVAAADIVTFWLTTGLLQERTWGEHTFLVFRHLTFQEYCVAAMLHQSWQRQLSRTWSYLKPRLHLANWRESLLLLSEMMEPVEIDQLISYLLKHPSPYDRALQRDIRLAAVLLGENRCASEAITEQVVKRLERLMQPSKRQVWVVSAVMGIGIAVGLSGLLLQMGVSIWVTGPLAILWILSCVGMLVFGLFSQLTVIVEAPLRLRSQTPVQTPFVEALGNIHHCDAVQALSHRFSFHEELYMRIAITKALANLGKLAIESLFRIAADEKSEVRTVVAKALVKTGKPAGELLLHELHKYASTKRIYSAKDDWINGEYYRANLAVYVLGEIGETRAVEPLLGLLNQQSLPVVTLARALGKLGDARAAEPIAQLLPTEEWEDDREIVHSLAMLGTAAVEPLVRILLRNQWHMLEMFAADALGEIGDRRAIQPLLEVVCHRDSEIYSRYEREWQAAEVLGTFEDVPIQPLIDALISTKHNAAVEHALQQIGKPAVESLIKLFYTNDWKLRGRVIDILHGIGSSAVVQLLQELSSNDLSFDSADPSESEQLRYFMGVITALGKRSNRDAIPTLISALKTSNLWLLHASIQALGDIADKKAVTPLVPFLEHKVYYIRSFTLQVAPHLNVKVGRFG